MNQKITAEWVLGYLTTDAPEDSRDAIRNAFTEWNALAATGKKQSGEALRDIDRAMALADRTDKIDRAKCVGMAVVKHIDEVRAGLAAQQPVCDTCDGSRVDPGGKPVCRDCVDNHQPVGEVIAWQHCGDGHGHLIISDETKIYLKERDTADVAAKVDAAYSIPLVRQPAQAADLSQFREVVEKYRDLLVHRRWDAKEREKCAQLLTLINEQSK